MKTKISILAAAVILFSGIFIFNSCKKNTDEKQQSLQEKEDLLDVYRQKLKNEPTSTVEILNQKVKGYYGDIKGNRLPNRPKGPAATNASNCPDFGDSEMEQPTVVSIEREYTCGVGYRFLVKYKVVTEFYPVPGTSPNFSGGRVRLRNASNVTIYTTPQAQLIFPFTNNGVVGTNTITGGDLNELILTYRTDIVPENIYNNSTSIQTNLFIFTDCSNYATINIPYVGYVSIPGGQHTTMPCLRVDKVYWTARSGSTPPSLAGANIFAGGACFPANYVYPDKQEINFKKNPGDGNYTGIFNLNVNGLAHPSVATALINYYDVWYIDAANTPGLTPGNVQVRYRNNHMGGSTATGGPCVTQPDNTWVYETWYIN